MYFLVLLPDLKMNRNNYLCFVQISREFIDWKKASPLSSSLCSTGLKRSMKALAHLLNWFFPMLTCVCVRLGIV